VKARKCALWAALFVLGYAVDARLSWLSSVLDLILKEPLIK
jgi:hypothetical protein